MVIPKITILFFVEIKSNNNLLLDRNEQLASAIERSIFTSLLLFFFCYLNLN